VKLNHVWIAAQYRDAAKEIIYKLKFGRAKAGAKTVAGIIGSNLPDLPPGIIVSHIPTANNRVRLRGYDQAQLIARGLSEQRGWQHESLLIRTGKSRQVGAGRKERFKHLEKALKTGMKADISGKHILLIDDITTTGATIEAAAKILKNNGAKTVDVAVFAQPVR
jgi:ComF family protein